jgi:hypothetical protein
VTTVETATSLIEHCRAMAGALEERLLIEVPGIQIVPYPIGVPSSNYCVDIIPADPFIVTADFGDPPGVRVRWTVRARVTTTDLDAGFETLLRFMDPRDPASIQVALLAAGYGPGADQEGTSFREYLEDHIGCEMGVTHFL